VPLLGFREQAEPARLRRRPLTRSNLEFSDQPCIVELGGCEVGVVGFGLMNPVQQRRDIIEAATDRHQRPRPPDISFIRSIIDVECLQGKGFRAFGSAYGDGSHGKSAKPRCVQAPCPTRRLEARK
jgi:hypothetical protein